MQYNQSACISKWESGAISSFYGPHAVKGTWLQELTCMFSAQKRLLLVHWTLFNVIRNT
jgi:hypothetical protein